MVYKVGVVVMNNCVVDVEPKSCPHSSNERFHALIRVAVVHILLAPGYELCSSHSGASIVHIMEQA